MLNCAQTECARAESCASNTVRPVQKFAGDTVEERRF
jgi:hypothetical protein